MLYFVAAPAAIVLVVAALTLPGNRRRAKRYRPGRPFDFTPVWFLSSPGQLGGQDSDRPALSVGAGSTVGALTADGQSEPAESRDLETRGAAKPHGLTGGASDRW